MSELFAAFGLDWRLLVINLVNFGVLLAVLWYFLYAPVLKLLEDRKLKIAKGLEDARKSEELLQEIESVRQSKMAQAAQEADEALARARAAAAARERELVEEAGKRAEAIVAQAEAQAREEKAKAIADSKDEVAKLIVLGMEKAMAPGSARGK